MVQGRGVVLLPELRPIAGEEFRVGDPLMLKRPDGAEDMVRIGGLEPQTFERNVPVGGNAIGKVQRRRSDRDRSVVGGQVTRKSSVWRRVVISSRSAIRGVPEFH